ncbi:MAG: hypothetical protein D6710_05465, partial [Nitrospirae bacterium]
PGTRKAEASTETPRIKAYRPIGKTGLKMSDISLGTGRPPALYKSRSSVNRLLLEGDVRDYYSM